MLYHKYITINSLTYLYNYLSCLFTQLFVSYNSAIIFSNYWRFSFFAIFFFIQLFFLTIIFSMQFQALNNLFCKKLWKVYAFWCFTDFFHYYESKRLFSFKKLRVYRDFFSVVTPRRVWHEVFSKSLYASRPC